MLNKWAFVTVHPVPAPFSTNADNNNKINAGGSNQNEILFNLGKAINNVSLLFLISSDYVFI